MCIRDRCKIERDGDYGKLPLVVDRERLDGLLKSAEGAQRDLRGDGGAGRSSRAGAAIGRRAG